MNSQIDKKNLIVLAAGGTGGHLFPAEAVARILIDRGYKLALLTDMRTHAYGGTLGSIDTHFIYSSHSWSIKFISILSGALLTLFRVIHAYKILKSLSPSVVIGFGGYPSLPTLLAAKAGRIKTVIHEQNAVAGRANKLLAPISNIVATSYLETQGLNKNKGNIIHTGNPVRADINKFRKIKYKAPQNGDKIKILVIGGSQGSKYLDNIIPKVLLKLPSNLISRIQLTIQCRPENIDQIRRKIVGSPVDAKIAEFYDNIAELLADAHLVISRAGASTISELAIIGRPALLVPYPHATNKHQHKNAYQFSKSGGAEVIIEENHNYEIIASKITNLLLNTNKLAFMAQASHKSGIPNAAINLANLIETLTSSSECNINTKTLKKREA
ncbi:MAG: undecaprenyldiphospho-muramoylpentapeptide beta-N-acetylglucosaminyltransferase [Alphaproteobacteria bacterium]|nr:undecaprenyldiphospho-muramoylpentapeptide beta-N-acetylglucosaminyltransferase [Alphaproteobacteria bacterium]|tara:strand:- start:990 stop:2144 length:1155 start_codon:yes stop_codon:yes gene_type:complete